jgi:hypothetical protein
MLVRIKERRDIFFKDVKVGQVFREDNNEYVFMKIEFEDDYICCPRCDTDISINDEKGKTYAVELNSGLVYEFDPHSTVEIVQGAFVEE